MYKILRETHLLLGLALTTFVLMFGISSLRFAHNDWFSTKPVVEHLTVAVAPMAATTPRALARTLMVTEGYRGQINRIRENEETIRLNIARMGTIHEVTWQRGASAVAIKKRVFPLMGMLTWMNVMFRVDHEYAFHNVWGWLMFFTSIGLLVLGGTGIYLWFKIYRERLIGLVLLGGNLVFGLALILLLYAG